MARYIFSIIRCVPEPSTGEFINVAAIAGRPETHDWALRQVANESRLRKLAGINEIGAVHNVLSRLGLAVDDQQFLTEAGGTLEDSLTEAWLTHLGSQLRNVVQLTPPSPIVADDAEQALDRIFASLIIDPVAQERGFVTKTRVFAELLNAYRMRLDEAFVLPRPDLFVGEHVHAGLDFAVANGRAVQLAQTWSFQRAGIGEVAEQVKSWGYALLQLRLGAQARLIGPKDRVAEVEGKEVDVSVVVAPPRTKEQMRVYDEARQIFDSVGAQVSMVDEADSVSERADQLLAKH